MSSQITNKRTQIYLLGLIILTTVATKWLHPNTFYNQLRPPPEIAEVIPNNFKNWQTLHQSTFGIVNPQTESKLRQLYSQTLSRSYVDDRGNVVMLSIAYSKNQSDSLTLHYPEACYPAQGFTIKNSKEDKLVINNNLIPVKKLTASRGTRLETITYWSVLGDVAVRRGLSTKIQSLRYGLQGLIPDGLIFRISSISSDLKKADELQKLFITDLMEALEGKDREFLFGTKTR